MKMKISCLFGEDEDFFYSIFIGYLQTRFYFADYL